MFHRKTDSSGPSRERGGDRGFTMIEIAVVLLVIAIIAAAVVPQVVAYMRKYRLGVAARNVATAVQRARYLATSNNKRAGVFIAEIQRVDIEEYDPEGKAEPVMKGSVHLPEGVTFSADAPKAIAFDGRGVVTPLPKQSPTIRVNGPSGYYMTVTVSPTGQVTLSETKQDDDV